MSSDTSRRRFLSSTAATAVAGLVAAPRLSARSGSNTFLASFAAGDNAGDVAAKPNIDWKDQGVLSLGRSPYAKLQSVPVHAVD
jgi:nitrous oxide reductase